MKTITFITSNQTKIRHARKALNGLDLDIVGKKFDFIEPREEDTEKVVLEKVVQAFKVHPEPLMVEDSGIYIRALNGFPKTFVYFVRDTIGVGNIIKMMEGVGDRYAEFRQSLAYIEPSMSEPIVFTYIDGGYSIADKVWSREHENAGEFDRILIPPGEEKPLCCFSPEWRAKRDTESNLDTIHYRQLAKWLSSRLD